MYFRLVIIFGLGLGLVFMISGYPFCYRMARIANYTDQYQFPKVWHVSLWTNSSFQNNSGAPAREARQRSTMGKKFW